MSLTSYVAVYNFCLFAQPQVYPTSFGNMPAKIQRSSIFAEDAKIVPYCNLSDLAVQLTDAVQAENFFVPN